MEPVSALMIGGGILKTIFGLGQSAAQQAQLEARADVARMNAAQTRVEKGIAIEKVKNETSRAIGSQRTQASAGNLVSTQGSALDILLSGASKSYEYQSQLSQAYDVREQGFLRQAQAYDNGAEDAGSAGIVSAGSSLLGLAKDVGDTEGWW
jgi:hypothetical protein